MLLFYKKILYNKVNNMKKIIKLFLINSLINSITYSTSHDALKHKNSMTNSIIKDEDSTGKNTYSTTTLFLVFIAVILAIALACLVWKFITNRRLSQPKKEINNLFEKLNNLFENLNDTSQKNHNDAVKIYENQNILIGITRFRQGNNYSYDFCYDHDENDHTINQQNNIIFNYKNLLRFVIAENNCFEIRYFKTNNQDNSVEMANIKE